jgi:drug/metabolite transporter (DMT)-like permease
MVKIYFNLHFIVFILGFTAILGNLITVSSISVVFYRTLIASLVLYFMLNKSKSVISLKSRYSLLGIGAILGVHWLCFFGSARLSNVSVSLVTFSTTSFFTSLFQPLVLNKRVDWKELLLSLLAVFGMGIIFRFEINHLSGIILGLLGSIFAAFLSIFNSIVTQKFDSKVISFYELLGALLIVLIFLPYFFITEFVGFKDFHLSSLDLFWVLILSLVCTVYPYEQMVKILRNISAFTANLSLNMEPIYGILMAVLIFGEKEKMSKEFYFGAVLILFSVIIHPFLTKRT